MSNAFCLLQSSSSQYPSIKVGQEKVFIGRNVECNIKCLSCSKKQLSVKVSWTEGQGSVLLINRLGPNVSFLNDEKIEQSVVYEGKDGDKIKVVPGADFYYTINFNSFEAEMINDTTTKRKSESSADKLLMDLSNDDLGKSSPPIKRPKVEASPQRQSSQIKPQSQPEVDTSKTSPEQQLPEQLSNTWEEIDDGKLLIFTSKGVKSSSKIASYDVDGTIITTKSNRVFPKDCDDWKIAFNEVPGDLKNKHKQGYKIVFFTNQAGVSHGKLKVSDLKRKMEAIVSKLNVPIQIFIATGKGKYRKPVTGSWEYMIQNKNDGLVVDLEQSFYCGDAAGRHNKNHTKHKKDHSSADRLFALNIGLKFFTPEEHFQKKPAEEWIQPEFHPQTLTPLPLIIPKTATIARDTQEVVLMVGCPASGKSYFAKKHFECNGYVYINRDTLNTWQKCVTAMENALKAGKSAVIDNTNPDIESRNRYIIACKRYKVPVRCFQMLTSNKQARHNNVFREIVDRTHTQINDIAFNGYFSKFKEPSLEEGFEQIVSVNFVPEFDNPDHEKLYKLYLSEK